MEETINYIVNKYLVVIQDKIGYAVSVLENNDYEGKEYLVRQIVESIRDNNLANMEREIENDYPSIKKLEQDLSHNEIVKQEKEFNTMYNNIQLCILDFLDNDSEKDTIQALRILNELDKQLDNYKKNLSNIKKETVVEKDLNETLDVMEEYYDELNKHKEEEKIDDNIEYDRDAFLKSLSNSKEFFNGIKEESYDNIQNNDEMSHDQQIRMLKESSQRIKKYMDELKDNSQKNTDEFIDEVQKIYDNSNTESKKQTLDDYDLTPIDVKIDELIYGKKDPNINEEDYLHLNDPEYTKYLSDLTDKYNKLIRKSDKEKKKLGRNQKNLNRKELDYGYLKKVNDDRRERKVRIPTIDYLKEGKLNTTINRLTRKIQQSETTINELKREQQIIDEQLFTPTLDVEETLRNNRLTGLGNYRKPLANNSSLIKNTGEVQIVGTTQDFINYDVEETQKGLHF